MTGAGLDEDLIMRASPEKTTELASKAARAKDNTHQYDDRSLLCNVNKIGDGYQIRT